VTRRGKIVCTLGPATGTDDAVRALVDAGMDVARLNFSHGDHAEHRASYERVRKASEVTGRAVGILADLQGPKIRLGRFADGKAVWENGDTVRITVEECEGSHDRVSTTYKQLAEDAKPGDRLLIDDGKVAVTVERIDGDDVVCTVTEGGPVSNNKGLSLPGVAVSVPALSAKDIDDLEFALTLGVDWIALSFVRSPADIELVHEVMDRVGRRVPVIAKLEKPEAVARMQTTMASGNKYQYCKDKGIAANKV
jgi:pyruvate kinase